MDPFTVNWAYYRHWLKPTIPGNPTISSVEEIDTDITTFTSTIKTEKKPLKTLLYIPASRLGHSSSRGTLAKKKKDKEVTCTILTGAANRRQYNFLKKLYKPPLETLLDSKI
jgi:hypothetical protein